MSRDKSAEERAAREIPLAGRRLRQRQTQHCAWQQLWWTPGPAWSAVQKEE